MNSRGDIIILRVETGRGEQQELIDPVWVARCVQTNLISTVTETCHMELVRNVHAHGIDPIRPPSKDHVFSLLWCSDLMLCSKGETVICTISANVCQDDLEVLRKLVDVAVPLGAGAHHVVVSEYEAGARAHACCPDLEIGFASETHRYISALNLFERYSADAPHV